MGDGDAKGIGLAAKDIVLGLGTVAAGATMGPAGAEGVNRAGGALDKILRMAGVAEDSTGSAAQKKDSAAGVAEGAQGRVAASSAGPKLGADAQTAVEYLQRLGWPREAALRMVQGPERSPERERSPESVGNPRAAHARSMVVERAGYAPDVRLYDADALMLRGVGITTERLEPHEEV